MKAVIESCGRNSMQSRNFLQRARSLHREGRYRAPIRIDVCSENFDCNSGAWVFCRNLDKVVVDPGCGVNVKLNQDFNFRVHWLRG